MTIQQLSIFLENKPGSLSQPCRALAAAGIDIVTLTLADTEKFGILRLIVRDAEKARAAVEKAGCVVRVSDVLAVEIPDRPGGLASVLAVLDPAAINIAYMYAFTLKRGGNAVMIVRFEDPERAIQILRQHQIALLDAATLFQLA